MMSPCKGCTNRHDCCWSSCQGYQEYKKIIADNRKAEKIDSAIMDVKFHGLRDRNETMKKKGKKKYYTG